MVVLKFDSVFIGLLLVLAAAFASAFTCPANATLQYGQNFSINTTVTTNLTSYPARIVMDTASEISAGRMLSTCADILVTNSTPMNLTYYIKNGTCNTGNTQIFARLNNAVNFKDFVLPVQNNVTVCWGNTTAMADHQNATGVYQFKAGDLYNASAIWDFGYNANDTLLRYNWSSIYGGTQFYATDGNTTARGPALQLFANATDEFGILNTIGMYNQTNFTFEAYLNMKDFTSSSDRVFIMVGNNSAVGDSMYWGFGASGNSNATVRSGYTETYLNSVEVWGGVNLTTLVATNANIFYALSNDEKFIVHQINGSISSNVTSGPSVLKNTPTSVFLGCYIGCATGNPTDHAIHADISGIRIFNGSLSGDRLTADWGQTQINGTAQVSVYPNFFIVTGKYLNETHENISSYVNVTSGTVSLVLFATNESGAWKNYTNSYQSGNFTNAASSNETFTWYNNTGFAGNNETLFFQICGNSSTNNWNCTSVLSAPYSQVISVAISSPANLSIQSNGFNLSETTTGIGLTYNCSWRSNATGYLTGNFMYNSSNTSTGSTLVFMPAANLVFMNVTCFNVRGVVYSFNKTTTSNAYNTLGITQFWNTLASYFNDTHDNVTSLWNASGSNVSMIIFSTNESGNWINVTGYGSPFFVNNSNSTYFNASYYNASLLNETVFYIVFANNSYNQWNNTGVMNFTYAQIMAVNLILPTNSTTQTDGFKLTANATGIGANSTCWYTENTVTYSFGSTKTTNTTNATTYVSNGAIYPAWINVTCANNRGAVSSFNSSTTSYLYTIVTAGGTNGGGGGGIGLNTANLGTTIFTTVTRTQDAFAMAIFIPFVSLNVPFGLILALLALAFGYFADKKNYDMQIGLPKSTLFLAGIAVFIASAYFYGPLIRSVA